MSSNLNRPDLAVPKHDWPGAVSFITSMSLDANADADISKSVAAFPAIVGGAIESLPRLAPAEALRRADRLLSALGHVRSTKLLPFLADDPACRSTVAALLRITENAGTALARSGRPSLGESIDSVLRHVVAFAGRVHGTAFSSSARHLAAFLLYLSGDFQRSAMTLSGSRLLGLYVDPNLLAFASWKKTNLGASALIRAQGLLVPPATGIGEWARFSIQTAGAPALSRALETLTLTSAELPAVIRALTDAGYLEEAANLALASPALDKADTNAILKALAKFWRPDVAARFATRFVGSPAEWDPVSVIMVARSLVFCGAWREASRLALAAFDSNPRHIGLCQLLFELGLKQEAHQEVETIARDIGAGLLPERQVEVTRLIEYLATLQEFALARELASAAAPHKLPETVSDGAKVRISKAPSNDAVWWLARIQEFSAEDNEALSTYYALSALEGLTARVGSGIARCLYELGDVNGAYEALIASHAHLNEPEIAVFDPVLYDIRLARGDIRTAFSLYRKRPQTKSLRSLIGADIYPESPILAEPVASALFISEGGPGDEIRFAGLYPEIARRVDKPSITCDPRLFTILSRSFPSIRFLPIRRYRRQFLSDIKEDIYSQRSAVSDAALSVLLDNATLATAAHNDRVSFTMDLLAELRSGPEAFPKQGGYLQVDPELQSLWGANLRHKVGGKTAVGLAWRSVLQSMTRNRHYSSVTDWEPLFQNPEIAVVSLQSGIVEAERQLLRDRGWTLHEFPELDLKDDFEGTGALTCALDWVVAPCTTILEFAGALGKRSFLFSGSEQLSWRQLPDGTDIWHSTVDVDLSHREPTFEQAAQRIAARISDGIPD